jgi:hypothetical protein
MWDYLWERSSNRKRQLFACACCRRIWSLLTKLPEPFRRLVALSEQAADGLVTDAQIDDAWPFTELESNAPCGDEGLATLSATGISARGDYQETQQYAASAAAGQPPYRDLDPTIPAVAAELQAQMHLLRCILGNPFHPIACNPSWLSWHDGMIPKLAQAIYDERAFDRMAILADALEEAGCTDQNILGHCRSAGEHAKGCWVIDVLLGKS